MYLNFSHELEVQKCICPGAYIHTHQRTHRQTNKLPLALIYCTVEGTESTGHYNILKYFHSIHALQDTQSQSVPYVPLI